MEDQEVEEEGEEEVREMNVIEKSKFSRLQEDDEEMDESAFIFDPNEVDDSEEEEVELNMAKDSFEDFEDTFKPTKSNQIRKIKN